MTQTSKIKITFQRALPSIQNTESNDDYINVNGKILFKGYPVGGRFS